jgi:putative flippase GtrA
MWIAGGIAITIFTIVLPTEYRFIAFMGIIGIITIIPFVFSYLFFKKNQQK